MIDSNAIKDEDDLGGSSSSDSHLATQQSIKAYVDAQVSSVNNVLDIDSYNAETLIDQDDLLVISDFSDNSGTEKKITFSNFEDQIFSNINANSSYLTVAVGGGISIDNLAITNGMLAGSIENSKLVNSAITIGTTSISLGTTSTTLSGINELTVDNVKIDGNSITSTDIDGNIIISPNGAGSVNVSTSKIINLSTPVAGTDAATKDYVDSVASGIQPFQEVKAATTTNLTANYTSGNTLTSGSNSAFTTDTGITFAQGDRVLVKDQTAQIQNGIYTITTLGSGSATWVLTRSSDFPKDMTTASGVFVFVKEGSTNGNSGFVCISPDGSDTVDSHSIIWSSFSNAGTITAGRGLDSSFNLDLSNTNGLVDIGSEAIVKDDLLAIHDTSLTTTNSTTVENFLSDMSDGSTISTDANGKLEVKDEGVTFAKVQKIQKNTLLGYVTTNTGDPDPGVVSQVSVKQSTTNNSEWNNPNDLTIPTLKSVKNLFDSAVTEQDSGITIVTFQHGAAPDSLGNSYGSLSSNVSTYDMSPYYTAGTYTNHIYELSWPTNASNQRHIKFKLPQIGSNSNNGDTILVRVKNTRVNNVSKGPYFTFSVDGTSNQKVLNPVTRQTETNYSLRINTFNVNYSYTYQQIDFKLIAYKHSGNPSAAKPYYWVVQDYFSNE